MEKFRRAKPTIKAQTSHIVRRGCRVYVSCPGPADAVLRRASATGANEKAGFSSPSPYLAPKRAWRYPLRGREKERTASCWKPGKTKERRREEARQEGEASNPSPNLQQCPAGLPSKPVLPWPG